MSVVVVLGLIWAAVLVPPMLRARAERRAEFIDSFQEHMGALRKGHEAAEAAQVAKTRTPRRKVSVVKRRRDVLGGLVGAMLGAFVLGAIPSLRPVWILFLFLLNTFLFYVTLLVHYRDKAAAARRPMAARAPARAPAVAERRSGRAERRVLTPAFEGGQP